MFWLCIHLPDLALEIFTRGAPVHEPLAVSDGTRREPRVLRCNATAARCGITPGMRLAAAHALAGSLQVRARDPETEHAALAQLAAWAGQFTPMVSLAPPQALVLEVEGSLRLFGSLEHLLGEIREGVRALGYAALLAVAPTPLAATWLARQGRESVLTDTARLSAALFALPLHCLGLTEEQCTLLHGLGLVTFGECLRLPRDGLARRLGPEFVNAIDRAFGRAPDPRPPFVAPPVFAARLLLPAPVAETGGLLFALKRLLLELAGFLAARAAGVQRLTLELHHASAETTQMTLALVSPTRDAAYLLALMRERLERVVLPGPVEEMTLRSLELRALGARNLDFFSPERSAPEARAALVERLKARLGRKAVCGLSQVAEHRPERAWCYVEPGAAEVVADVGQRPLWLLPDPLPLDVHEGRPYLDGPLALAHERERIESGWWDGSDVARDYFIAHDTRGVCLWIFRELVGEHRWFLHGIFG